MNNCLCVKQRPKNKYGDLFNDILENQIEDDCVTF